jgi:hypothetical protein
MSDDPKSEFSPPVTHTVSIDYGVPAEALGSVAVTVPMPFSTEPTPLSALLRALKENRTEIVVRLPWWLPYVVVLLFVYLMMMASGQLSVFQGLSSGYNVEHCSKIVFKGVEFSDCVKLTKP